VTYTNLSQPKNLTQNTGLHYSSREENKFNTQIVHKRKYLAREGLNIRNRRNLITKLIKSPITEET